MVSSGRQKKITEISAHQLEIRRAVRKEREKWWQRKRKCLEQQKDALALVQAAAMRAAEETLKASQDEACQLKLQVASLETQLKLEKEKATEAAMLKEEVARLKKQCDTMADAKWRCSGLRPG